MPDDLMHTYKHIAHRAIQQMDQQKVKYDKRLAKQDTRIERRDAKIVELEQQLQQVREAVKDYASSSSKRQQAGEAAISEAASSDKKRSGADQSPAMKSEYADRALKRPRSNSNSDSSSSGSGSDRDFSDDDDYTDGKHSKCVLLKFLSIVASLCHCYRSDLHTSVLIYAFNACIRCAQVLQQRQLDIVIRSVALMNWHKHSSVNCCMKVGRALHASVIRASIAYSDSSVTGLFMEGDIERNSTTSTPVLM
eukprot:9209-Heterococcus_DN1.PRE.1